MTRKLLKIACGFCYLSLSLSLRSSISIDAQEKPVLGMISLRILGKRALPLGNGLEPMVYGNPAKTEEIQLNEKRIRFSLQKL